MMNASIAIPLLFFSVVLIVIIFLLGLMLKPFAKKKITEIILKELKQRKLTLKETIQPTFPNTGPFKDSYPPNRVDSIASIMGLYPDYTAYRELSVVSENEKEEIIWMKIEFDVLRLKRVELRKESDWC